MINLAITLLSILYLVFTSACTVNEKIAENEEMNQRTETDISEPSVEKEKELSMKEEFRGSQADIDIGPSRDVIKDEREWKKTWSTAQGSRMPRREPPEIDFEKHMVLAVFMGRRPTGGYSIEIKSVREYENHIEAHYSLTTPGPDDMVIQVITSPYHLVIIPRVEDKEVKFIQNQDEPDVCKQDRGK